MSKRVHVVIIGAGAAGVAAATRLLEKGFSDFVVIEAKNRVGGRLYSTPYAGGSVDVGAEWVHGEEGNVVYQMVSPYGLLYKASNPFELSQVFRSDGSVVSKQLFNQLIEIFDDIIDHSPEEIKAFSGSLGDYFETKFWPRVDPLINKGELSRKEAEDWVIWMEKMENSIDGSASWYQTSVKEAIEYVKCPGEVLIAWKSRGYSTVLDLLSKKIPNPNKALPLEEKLMLNKEVTRVAWDGTGVQVTCADGTEILADRVLTTVSLNVLQAHANDIFQPKLPDTHMKAIQNLGMGTIDKIFITFPYRWWPAGSGGISCFWRAEDRNAVPPEQQWITSIFGFYQVDSQPLTTLCGWIGGEEAIAMESATDKQVLDACIGVLKRFAGSVLDIPDPVSILRSRWGTDPHVRGSYSCRMISSDKENVWPSDLAEPVRSSTGDPRLLFAGEATHQHFFSTVHGAIETGWREADRILALRKREERCSVVVVGAGIAGLAASRTLTAAGVDTLVLEAQEEAGGRLRSIPVAGGYVELGAQWLHGQNTKLHRIAEERRFVAPRTEEEGRGQYCRPDGSTVSSQIVREVSDIVTRILSRCEEFVSTGDAPPSVAEELDKQFNLYLARFSGSAAQIRRDLYSWHKRFQLIDNSCDDLNQLSAQAWGLYEDCGSDHCVALTPCMTSFVKSLVAELPSRVVRYRSPIKRINWLPIIDAKENRPRVTVILDDSIVYADHIIVTASLGYLKNNKELFHPRLPDAHNQAIDLLGFGTIAKIFLQFDESWWGKDEGFQFVWTEDPELEHLVPWADGVTGFDVLPGRPFLLGWVGGVAARIVETRDIDQLRNEVIVLLRKFSGRANIPTPISVIRSSWSQNEYICGSYSNVTSKCDAANVDCGTLAEPVMSHIRNKSLEQVPTILLAGEACHRSHYSTVHGAYESGCDQANVILNYQKNSNLSKL